MELIMYFVPTQRAAWSFVGTGLVAAGAVIVMAAVIGVDVESGVHAYDPLTSDTAECLLLCCGLLKVAAGTLVQMGAAIAEHTRTLAHEAWERQHVGG